MSKTTLGNMSDEELFHTSLLNLKHALLQQSQSQRRVADRVKTLIRSLMMGLGSALIFILYLIYILTGQVDALSTSLDAISKQATAVQESMTDIDIVMITFETYLQELPRIDTSVTKVEKSVTGMAINVTGITNNLSIVTDELGLLRTSLSGMNQNVLVLSQVLQRVNRDVADGVKPVERFNSMNPFNFMR